VRRTNALPQQHGISCHIMWDYILACKNIFHTPFADIEWNVSETAASVSSVIKSTAAVTYAYNSSAIRVYSYRYYPSRVSIRNNIRNFNSVSSWHQHAISNSPAYYQLEMALLWKCSSRKYCILHVWFAIHFQMTLSCKWMTLSCKWITTFITCGLSYPCWKDSNFHIYTKVI
jgi:hypothetical protein